MDFKVHNADGYEDFSGDDRYWFDRDHGHLITMRSDGRQKTYSANAWTYIEEHRDRDDASTAEGYL